MKTTIGAFDSEGSAVPVKFVHNGVTHSRSVNAVLDAEGAYDRAATKARVDDVARGVAHKIEIGVLKNAVAQKLSSPE